MTGFRTFFQVTHPHATHIIRRHLRSNGSRIQTEESCGIEAENLRFNLARQGHISMLFDQLNPKLSADGGTIDDLSWRNFIKEIFLDSETSIGLISTPPGPYPQEAVVPPKEMAHIRDEINRLAGSQRMLAHGLATPQLGLKDLDFMAMQAETLKVDAWKCYTGS